MKIDKLVINMYWGANRAKSADGRRATKRKIRSMVKNLDRLDARAR